MTQAKRETERRHGHDVAYEKLPQSGLVHWFTRISSSAAARVGSPWAFLAALTIVLLWAATGPLFNYSSDWSLAINTITTIITFLMVFVIQNTQNRDAKAMHLKLDELLRATPRARKEFMEAEEEDLDEIEREKAIVDRDDPNPPAGKRDGMGHAGNGKSKGFSPPR